MGGHRRFRALEDGEWIIRGEVDREELRRERAGEIAGGFELQGEFFEPLADGALRVQPVDAEGLARTFDPPYLVCDLPADFGGAHTSRIGHRVHNVRRRVP